MHTLKAIKIESVFLFVFVIGGFAATAGGRSVYAITDRHSTVTAYDINGVAIDYQTTDTGLPDQGDGAVGLALDPGSKILFVTYEGSDIIEMLNAKTMLYEGLSVTAPDAPSAGLAGMAFDQTNQKLYVVGRESDQLYVYLWDARRRRLTLEGETYKTLTGLSEYGAYGLALDPCNSRLYVTDRTSTVHYYDTGTWEHEGSVDIVVNSLERKAIGIAIDSTHSYMYTGAFTGTDELHTRLVRTDINDVNNPTSAEHPAGSAVIGLTVDERSGILYVTTHNHDIEVYDCNTWPSDPCYTETSNISGPADIIVRGDVSYRAPGLTIAKVHDVSGCLMPGETITYTISYDANGWADSNVVLTDYLPVAGATISQSIRLCGRSASWRGTSPTR